MRRATAQDEAGIAALAAASGGRGWWGREQRSGGDHPDVRRWVETDGDRVVGYGAVWRREHGIFGLDTLVHPDIRKGGLGRRIIDQLFEDLAELGAAAVEARVDADHMGALTFMVRRGFAEINRLERLKLELDKVALPVEGKLPPGVTILSLAESHDSREALTTMLTAAFRERPIKFLAPFTETPMERLGELDTALPDGSFVAHEGDAVVGFTGLGPGPDEHTLTAFLTAVVPSHRHQGLATALKRRAIAYAKGRGAKAIESNSPNRDMQDLNEMLGFERSAVSEIRMGRRL